MSSDEGEVEFSVENGTLSKFDELFANQEIYESPAGKNRVVDVSPEFPRTELPVTLLSGMGATPEVNKQIIQTFWKDGRRTLSMAYDRKGGKGEVTPEVSFGAEEQIRKADALIDALERKGIGKTDVVGHSEGALVAIIAASKRPDLFRNIILLDPAGMVGESNVMQLVIRQMKENIAVAKRVKADAEAKAGEALASREFNKHLSDSGPRALDELKGVAGSQIQDVLGSLHQLGIGISIIHGRDDLLFPMKQIQKIAGSSLLSTEVQNGTEWENLSIDGFYSVSGRHNEIQFQPQRYTEVVIEALDALDRKKNTGKPTELPHREAK